jgi:hypothetical protein
MAAVATDCLAWIPIAYLATVRRDGAPRVHPVCPIIAGGRMYVAVAGPGGAAPSPKRFDLLNDGRYALHTLPGKRDDEFYATGRARRAHDPAVHVAVAAAAGHTVHREDWIFELDLESVMTAFWEKRGEPDTYAVRRFWNATS